MLLKCFTISPTFLSHSIISSSVLNFPSTNLPPSLRLFPPTLFSSFSLFSCPLFVPLCYPPLFPYLPPSLILPLSYLHQELEERLRHHHHAELQSLREAHRQSIETLKQQSEQELQTLRFELEDEGKAMLGKVLECVWVCVCGWCGCVGAFSKKLHRPMTFWHIFFHKMT